MWSWYRIDEEMEKQYKAHGNTYQFIWVRHLMRLEADEYEASRAADAQKIRHRERQLAEVVTKLTDANETIAAREIRIKELEAQLAEALKPKPMRVPKVPDSEIYLGEDDDDE